MRQAWRCGFVLCTAIVQGASAQMQVGPQQQTLGGNQSVVAAIMQPVTGRPYQAEQVSRSVQTLSDGTVLTHETKGMIARDTDGRIREDLYIVHSGQVNGREMDLSLQSATVGDPVTHTTLIWTGGLSKIATLMQFPALPTYPSGIAVGGVLGSAPPPPPVKLVAPPKPAPVVVSALPPGWTKDQVRTEELGQQSLEGLLVTGKRTTTTIPIGKVGNDRPFDVIHEEWRSPELNITVKTLDKDPRTGVQTMELHNLVRTEPDAALFHAPVGYEVKDMAALMKGLGDVGKPAAK
jgi:hypothetical protein